MSENHLSAVPHEESRVAPEEVVEESELDALRVRVKKLEEDVALLAGMAHNSHSIDPEVIDSIAKRGVQQMSEHLQTVLKMGNTLLEK